MSEKEKDDILITDSDLDRQISLYQHHEKQAQTFLRSILTGIAIFGVSIGTATLTSWEKIKALLPNSVTIVTDAYNVNKDFVEATNEINLFFALFAIFVAFAIALDSSKFMIRALQIPPINPILEENKGKTKENVNRAISRQFKYLRQGYILAKWSGALTVGGGILILTSLIGRADLLAIVDLIVAMSSFLIVLYFSPGIIFEIIERVKSINVQDSVNKVRDWGEKGEQISSDEIVTPDFLIFALLSGLWAIWLLYGGLIGFIW